jgi:hypothetical protein
VSGGARGEALRAARARGCVPVVRMLLRRGTAPGAVSAGARVRQSSVVLERTQQSAVPFQETTSCLPVAQLRR